MGLLDTHDCLRSQYASWLLVPAGELRTGHFGEAM